MTTNDDDAGYTCWDQPSRAMVVMRRGAPAIDYHYQYGFGLSDRFVVRTKIERARGSRRRVDVGASRPMRWSNESRINSSRALCRDVSAATVVVRREARGKGKI